MLLHKVHTGRIVHFNATLTRLISLHFLLSLFICKPFIIAVFTRNN